mmetsp:Transcript_23563/g.23505  ORF Transcript_23563/g.23505 Transcript_23563/m.23505 type:complete len:130 (-) Transcript_23563:41-430(-)
MHFEFTSYCSSKIDPKNINFHTNYNEDSTEEFDNSVSQMMIRLPACKNYKSKIVKQKSPPQNHTSLGKRVRKSKNGDSKTQVGSITTDSKSNLRKKERTMKGPFIITKERNRQRITPASMSFSEQVPNI